MSCENSDKDKDGDNTIQEQSRKNSKANNESDNLDSMKFINSDDDPIKKIAEKWIMNPAVFTQLIL